MRLLDDTPMDPEVAAALDAIDSTLAGEPVDPRYAELAELALLLADDRPRVDPVFVHNLDERVSGGFGGAAREAERPSRRSGWSGWMAGGAAVALVAAVVALFVFIPDINDHAVSSSGTSSASSAGAAASSSSSGGPTQELSAASGAASGSATSAASSQAYAPAAGAGRTPQPQSNGRKTIQSAQLNLFTAPSRVDDVAQEAFDVVGQENGIVNRSSVTQTGSADGNAFMQLSVPSSALAQTMTKLSQLTYARVASRTDNSQDVNNQYVQSKRRLADAQALRTSLLKQLANAVTTEQVDSLKAQIRDAERSIAADESALARLNHRIAFSNISLTIYAGAQPPATPTHHSGGFTLGKATHDAGRVLVVVAGVMLIALAVLLPVAALAALAWWVGGMVTHRRRERALDLA
ncbi:MAG TPA: DUF4349 domain-containing protein [Solirubrobacteraceae bacterium]|nr:DUF4349 domain-containing protein [Solirubrobacteraceae bacterium]